MTKWHILEREVDGMDFRTEIDARVAQLSPDLQQEVLRFVSSLEAPAPNGPAGSTLRRFSGCLDHESAREMTRAIEEDCKRVDAGEW